MTTWHPSPLSRGTFYGDVAGHSMPRTLDAIMGLDCLPVRVSDDGTVTELTDAPYVPESLPAGDDGELIRECRSAGWEPLTGHTGQHGYRGPVMHASECIGSAMAAEILANPGIYAVTTVNDDAGEIAGWVTLRRQAGLTRRADGRFDVADTREANEAHGCKGDTECILSDGHPGAHASDRD